MFAYLVAAAVTVPAVILWTLWDGFRTRNINPLTEASRLRCAAVAKMLLAASTTAVVVLIIASQARPMLAGLRITRWGVACLVVSILSSALALQALSRRPSPDSSRASRGRLNRTYLLSVLIAAYFAVAGFLAGLAFIARSAFLL